MSKKYFDYSFQIKRTKTTLVIFIVVIIVALTVFFTWYNGRVKKVKLDDLQYKEIFGLNSFKAKDCDASYRVNYKKVTCGTICITKSSLNNNSLSSIKSDMEANGFKFTGKKQTKLGNKNWDYIRTNNNEPEFNYYSINTKNYTYTMEFVNQTKNLDKTNQNNCNKIMKKFNNSIKIND